MLNFRIHTILATAVAVIGIFPGLAIALDAPRDLRGTEIRQNTVKWEWAAVPGAAEYEVTVNDNMVGKTRSDEFISRDLPVGLHHMHVRAVAADGTRSAPTRLAKIRTSEDFRYGSHGRSYLVADTVTGKFGAPGGLWGKQISPGTVRWGWNEVAGAESYDVFIDGRYRATSMGRDIITGNLPAGERIMTVRAVSTDRQISDHSQAARVVVRGGAGAAQTAPAVVDRDSTAVPENTSGVEIAPGDTHLCTALSLLEPNE